MIGLGVWPTEAELAEARRLGGLPGLERWYRTMYQRHRDRMHRQRWRQPPRHRQPRWDSRQWSRLMNENNFYRGTSRRDLLWGRGTDFWTALEDGLVPQPEQRAVHLLSELCDPERVAIYCMSGCLPAMGNLSRNTYLVKKTGGADLIENGYIRCFYCISIDDANVPRTDSVLTIKNMIEGEEAMFLKIARKWTETMSTKRPKRVLIPHHEPFIPKSILKEYIRSFS